MPFLQKSTNAIAQWTNLFKPIRSLNYWLPNDELASSVETSKKYRVSIEPPPKPAAPPTRYRPGASGIPPEPVSARP